MAILNIDTGAIRALKQNIQSRYIRVELLNEQYQTIENLSGIATGGNITIDASADVRRTGNITMVVQQSSFEVNPSGSIWLDKYIRIWVGTYNIVTDEIVWANCGIFIIDAPKYSFDPSTNTLTLSLLDLMAKLTGLRNGQIEGITTKISAGESIRGAFIATLAYGGFTNYVISDPPSPAVVPNDLEFSQGATIYDMLSALRDIYPFYEIYFDINGTFYYQPIPTGEDDPVQIGDDIWRHIVNSETLSVNFQNVKNAIEVYGRTHEPTHFSTSTSVSNNAISLTMASVTSYEDGVIYGFTLSGSATTITSPTIEINDLGDYPAVDDDGNAVTIEKEDGEVYYCVQWQASTNTWFWLGHLQAYGYAEDDNTLSPYYVGGTIGKIRLVLYDDQYANIPTDDLAQQRAKRELYIHTNLQNTLTLNCVPVYWLDVNVLVEYTMQRGGETYQWLIQNITMGLGVDDTMTVTMARFYPEI